jgi:hypothetical protein
MGIWNKLSRFINHKITFWAVVFTAIIDMVLQGANGHWILCGILGGALLLWVFIGNEHWRHLGRKDEDNI